MANTKSRVQKTSGDPDLTRQARFLVRTLNDELGPASKGKRDVVDRRALLVLLRRFERLHAAIAKEKLVPRTKRNTESDEIMGCYRAVNRFLRRYVATPVIVPLTFSEPGDDSFGWDYMWSRTGKQHQPFMELKLVEVIQRLAASDRLSSLKQCQMCKRWIFARFPHQRFCSDRDCKEMFHRTDPGDRVRRREWARKNYQTRIALEAGQSSARSRTSKNKTAKIASFIN